MLVICHFEKPALQQNLKVSTEQVAVLRSMGRPFQALGAATKNALSPNRRLAREATWATHFHVLHAKTFSILYDLNSTK